MTTLRRAYRHVPAPVRQALESALIFDLPDRPPRPLDVAGGDNVVMLTSAKGTGILGCGGTLALHARLEAKVTAAIVVPIRQGGSPFPSEQARLRRDDGHLALSPAFESIGVRNTVPVNGGLSNTSGPGDADDLAHVLATIRPTIVYHPSLFSPTHEDRAVNQILLQAILRANGTRGSWAPALRGYEANHPLVANCYCDMSDAVLLKQAALDNMVPAFLDSEIVDSVAALNIYRSQAMQGGIGLAEAFQAFNAGAFARIMTIIEANDGCSAHS